MRTCSNEPDYEPLRTWALQPSSVRPPGVAQILRGGLITWRQTVQSLPPAQSGEIMVTQATYGNTTPLSQLVAAMIAEVLP